MRHLRKEPSGRKYQRNSVEIFFFALFSLILIFFSKSGKIEKKPSHFLLRLKVGS
jgi:hypothetical protein